MFQTVRNAFKVADLRKKILYTILIIIIFRLGSAITVPFLDPSVLKSIVTSDNSFLGYFNVLTGGGLEKATIFAMSITPYINASIIVQLLTVAIPYLERLQKEGEVGRKKLGKITRYLTFVLALIQAVGFFFLLKSNNAVEYSTGWEVWFTGIIIVAAFTAGSCLIVWLLISLFGTLALIAFQKYVTRHTASQAIEADSAHYTVDVATNLSIIVTLVVVKFLGWSWFDTLTAFAVSAYLLYNAYKLARDAVGLLTDRELDDEIRLNIKKIVLGHDFAHGIHDLRTRDLGGEYMFEFHLELDGALSLYQAHDYTDEVEKALLKAYPNAQIIVHEDPAGIDEDRLDRRIRCANPEATDCLL